jgi:hypothetical protein
MYRLPLDRPQTNKESAFVHPDNKTPIERVAISDGQNIEDLWYPWDILHFRRMYRLRISEHGEPIFDEAQGIYKKLRWPLTRWSFTAPRSSLTATSINIDTKDQPPMDQMKTVQRWKQTLRSKALLRLSEPRAAPASRPSSRPGQGFQSFLQRLVTRHDPVGRPAHRLRARHRENAGHAKHSRRLRHRAADRPLLLHHRHAALLVRRAKGGGGGGDQAMSGKALLAQDMRFLRKDQKHSAAHHQRLHLARLLPRGAQGQRHPRTGHSRQ